MGSVRGDEYKRPGRLGEGTGAKAPATARLRKGYSFKARLYLPLRLWANRWRRQEAKGNVIIVQLLLPCSLSQHKNA